MKAFVRAQGGFGPGAEIFYRGFKIGSVEKIRDDGNYLVNFDEIGILPQLIKLMEENLVVSYHALVFKEVPALPKFHLKSGTRVAVKKGYHEFGKVGVTLGNPVMVDQWWTPVKWDDEEDPTFFKSVGLEEV